MKKFMSVSSLARRFFLILATLLLAASNVGLSVAQTQPAVAAPPIKSVGEAKSDYDPTQPNSAPTTDAKVPTNLQTLPTKNHFCGK
jgi:hypothetical protein